MTRRKLGQFAEHLALINDLASKASKSVYEIGRELSIIKEHKLYKDAGFSGWTHFAASKDLNMTYNTADLYMKLYDNFTRLGFSADESAETIQQFSIHKLKPVLAAAKTRPTLRAIQRRINKADDSKLFTIAFEGDMAVAVLARLTDNGMVVSENGRRHNVKGALLKVMNISEKEVATA